MKENKDRRKEISFTKEKTYALFKGEIGSGKSVMLRCLLWQCIKKGRRSKKLCST